MVVFMVVTAHVNKWASDQEKQLDPQKTAI